MANQLPIISLAKMGVKRVTLSDGPADLITIYKSPYPVLRNYLALCNDLGIEPYAGGSHIHQGSMDVGYILSGYRDPPTLSPHGFAVALDIVIGDIREQIRAAKKAIHYFNRVGLYPENGFIHVDLFDDFNIEYYRKKRFWIRRNSIYTSFMNLKETIDFAQAV